MPASHTHCDSCCWSDWSAISGLLPHAARRVGIAPDIHNSALSLLLHDLRRALLRIESKQESAAQPALRAAVQLPRAPAYCRLSLAKADTGTLQTEAVLSRLEAFINTTR